VNRKVLVHKTGCTLHDEVAGIVAAEVDLEEGHKRMVDHKRMDHKRMAGLTAACKM
jgi:hypothetical protein